MKRPLKTPHQQTLSITMLKCKNIGCTFLPSSPLLRFSSSDNDTISVNTHVFIGTKSSKLFIKQAPNTRCLARRRVRYDEGDEDGEYGHNVEIAMLEEYSILATNEVLLVQARVDEQETQILVYKGFSSSLSYETSPDPSRSVLPARAVIESIDVIQGPFDPSNIQFIEKGLSWDTFKTRLKPN